MDVECLMAGFVTSFSLLHAFRYLVGSLWLCKELRRDLGYVFNGSFVWYTIVATWEWPGMANFGHKLTH